jgi:nicotinamidase-related amidase
MNAMKLALLIIDMQKACYVSGKESMDDAVPCINEAVSLFRSKDLPVIWVQNENKDKHIVPGSVEFEVIDSLNTAKEDKRIYKTYLNSFNKTDLLEYLQSRSIDTVIVTGYAAEYCVLSTCRGAKDHDLTSFLLRGALASSHREYISFVESINDIISLNALKKILE